MTRPNFRLAVLFGGLLLAAAPVTAQRSSSRSTPTPAPAPVVPTVGPTIVIVGETADPTPAPADTGRSRRSRSSGSSDAALELVWGKLGAGNATTIDVNNNPRLRLLLPSMGISVPRDGILRKPRSQSTTASASSGSAQPPAVGPITINLDGNFLLPEPLPPSGGPVVVYVAGEGGTTVSPTPAASNTRSTTDRRSSGSTYPSWSGGSGEGERQTQAASAPDEDDKRPEVTRHDNLPKTVPSFWQALDQDQDAQLSLYEWRTGGKSVEDFLALDENKNGQLEVDEYLEGVAAALVQPEAPPPVNRSSRYRR